MTIAPIRSTPRRSVGDRREQLAGEFLAGMRAFKRGLEQGLPQDLGDAISRVTMHQLDALVSLINSADGMTMNDLARCQGVGMSSCTALADRLIRQGLVERTSDPGDRRVVRLVPTEHGRVLVGRFQLARSARLLEMLTALDDDEVSTLNALIRRLASGGAPTERSS
jgi:DNA-binding MarR family transcriptional regulator